jgi:hypothetical protein
VILLIAVLVLFILALVGSLETPFFTTNLNWWQRLVAFVVSVSLFVLVGAAIVPATPGSMPIGTVVMWWGEGTKESLPHGFELCGVSTRNGNLSTLRSSVSLVEGSSKARHEKH